MAGQGASDGTKTFGASVRGQLFAEPKRDKPRRALQKSRDPIFTPGNCLHRTPSMNSVSVDSLPQGPPSDEHSVDLLLEKFSRLTFLLAGVTAVNNDNHHPTLRTIDRLSIDERVRYMKSNKSTHTVLMEAVTALLVQDSEVLASMARNTTSVITFQAPPTVATELVMKQISKASDPQQALFDYGECMPDTNFDSYAVDESSKVARYLYMFHNPTEKIEMDPTHETNQCVPVPIGKSYWDDIEKAGSGFIFPESGS